MLTTAAATRLSLVQRSIADWRAQTHSARELVVVLNNAAPDGARALAAHLAALGDPGIRLVELPGAPPLGAARNASLDAARGAVLCQWDDDDRHHPERLARQLAALEAGGRPAVLLRDVLHWFRDEGTVWSLNWAATPTGGKPASLMVRAEAAPRYYPHADAGEDLEAALELRAAGALSLLPDAPELLVYVAHGNNLMPPEHQRMLAERLGRSRGLLLRQEAALRAGMAPLDLGRVAVRGPNGIAFTLC
jgi:hypothetical protein